MTELEKIEYAKSFMDKLANGINPLDDTPIPEGDIVNHVRLSRCFFFVSEILQRVIDNGGVNPPAKSARGGKHAFSLTDEGRATLKVTDTPLTVSEIAGCLNDTIDENTTEKISAAAINGWLLAQGFLAVEERSDGKTRKLPTANGADLGICTEMRNGQYGPYTVVLFSAAAQTFIYDHVEAIVTHAEEVKAAKKEQRAAAKAEKAAARAVTPVPPPPVGASAHSGFLDRPWTEAHDERLRSMFVSGATISEMADTVKRTEAGIYARLRELGLQ